MSKSDALDDAAERYYPGIMDRLATVIENRPVGRCNRCQRAAWDDAAIGTEDRMTQPDGAPCGGTFEAC